MPKEGNGALFSAEFSFVAQQSLLVDIAQTKIQIPETPVLSDPNSLPDQQVVRPAGKITGERSVEFVVQRLFPFEKEIASNDIVRVHCQKQESLLGLHELPPYVLKENIRLREKSVLIFP